MKAAPATHRSPAIALVGASAVSVQFGAALATKLFDRVGPAGAVTLRLVLAAAVLTAAVRLRPGPRPAGRPPRSDWAVAAAFGLVLAAMNLSFYEAIARIPLGVAVTVEFSGPLALALAGSRRWADGLWAAAAGAGVILLASGAGRHLDPAGLGLALLAGAFWVGYILLSKETGRRFESFRGLAWAMTVGGVAVLPFGLYAGGSALVDPAVFGLGLAVAVLSSVVPYSLELAALRRVTPRAFGVMMSLDPALATAAGFVVLGQHLNLREWIALALVVGANAGNSLTGRAAGTGDVVATAP
ncbi:MAG TPA: EamA family transporter [Acidimicrobiales bacterium]|nr:EamA family transporter [Acidimicrobiales bacterium]